MVWCSVVVVGAGGGGELKTTQDGKASRVTDIGPVAALPAENDWTRAASGAGAGTCERFGTAGRIRRGGPGAGVGAGGRHSLPT